ncbi:DUF2169 family type VI secretion system accessory protein [Flexibacterium corallicola]|uniref:DUF2169 family type VI secretion system accessory protein n=1 Tax=Flexibacterium corallicola TaxID=3037259 RepID=UPI00286EEA8E|nr:DUF2169 domain-containing protein [Pseudovibrio sp. M1P-2-3]
MELKRHFPFSGMAFRQYDPNGVLHAVVAVSAAYEVFEGRVLRLQDEQPDLLLSDIYTGSEDPPRHLIKQADFIPYKPATDVTVLARAYTPSGEADTEWFVGIKVGDREKVLRVHGPRYWTPSVDGDGWEMGKGKAIKSLPLSYYQAFGGLVPATKPLDGAHDCHDFNPLGKGIISVENSPKDKPVRAPQIEDAHIPITDWREDYVPQGFAPLAPVWRFREQYAGTYDTAWIKIQHPFLPADFDYRFYNCAHPDLTFSPHLRGGERIQIANLHPEFKQIALNLPNDILGVVATRLSGTIERKVMTLDGVHFDLLDTIPKLRLTWRISFPWGEGITGFDAGIVQQSAAVKSGRAQAYG